MGFSSCKKFLEHGSRIKSGMTAQGVVRKQEYGMIRQGGTRMTVQSATTPLNQNVIPSPDRSPGQAPEGIQLAKPTTDYKLDSRLRGNDRNRHGNDNIELAMTKGTGSRIECGMTELGCGMTTSYVIPSKEGIQLAKVTRRFVYELDSRLRGNDRNRHGNNGSGSRIKSGMTGRLFRSLGSLAMTGTLLTLILTAQTAQASVLGVADLYKILDENVKDGDIISASGNDFTLSKGKYDSAILGVVSMNPALYFGYSENLPEKLYPVITSGTPIVNVTTINGPIKAGDAVTSSDIPGAGMKADKSGFVLGIALEAYEEADAQKIGQIPVTLNLRFYYPGTQYRRSQFDVFTVFDGPLFESPNTFIRYIMAIAVSLVSLATGAVYFGKIAKSGIEAMGRNPLAGKTIQFGVFVNVTVSIVLALSGVVVALLILKL